MARVFVAMSGGVDSSVAAALLVREGHDVTGVTLTLLPERDEPGRCRGTTGVRDAKRVCDLLGIPHYTLNAREAFSREVMLPFAHAYASGETPNPCIACNDRLKFAWLLERTLAQGADALVTGHYARVVDTPAGRAVARGVDPAKDQSYFLYRTTRERLARVMFPLGGMRKDEVRALATEMGLPTAEHAESQEVCFAPDGDHVPSVASACPGALEPGAFVTESGEEVGRHVGIARYTVGQRKGLGLPGGPWFVLRVDAGENRVVVGSRERLDVTRLTLREPVWDRGDVEARCEVVVRYRSRPIPATVAAQGDTLRVTLDEPAGGVAPGQSAVAYGGDVVLGGGVVADTG